ncbi:cytochrome b5-like heme/steroid binding domain-containing protein [Vararia minispora EC-137]|uniref:Cytochrome b5-like heme/steroid binding domain-containing protein n=1 Tax=Vararia minispora EC-137 TaxID=1314806 RepID=A0ACB8QRS5_9AGAM|nr:cytochrome b5-like heme/steroid binding domain-containing protein [Vararia minispora EC-137]
MSWISNIEGEPDLTYVDPHPKVPDPSIPNRMVSTKRANKPYLAYKEYRDRQEKLHQEWLERKKEREEKLARGEEVGPEEPDPTHEPEVGVAGLLKFIVYLLLFVLLTGKFVTGDFFWGYDGKWVHLKTYWPQGEGRLFSEAGLARFDGSNPDLPLYLAIDGDVYDVSSNRRVYGPGGSYHNMAGVDAARAFGTGCFAAHRTHDLRGLSERELRSVNHWKTFFRDHKDYTRVGRVSHPTIDPASPVPEPCMPPKDATKSDDAKHAGPQPENKKERKGHAEL